MCPMLDFFFLAASLTLVFLLVSKTGLEFCNDTTPKFLLFLMHVYQPTSTLLFHMALLSIQSITLWGLGVHISNKQSMFIIRVNPGFTMQFYRFCLGDWCADHGWLTSGLSSSKKINITSAWSYTYSVKVPLQPAIFLSLTNEEEIVRKQ